MQSRKLLTIQQAADLTGRKVSTWRRDIFQRKIAFVRIGRSVRIPIEVVEELIESGFQPPMTLCDSNSD